MTSDNTQGQGVEGFDRAMNQALSGLLRAVQVKVAQGNTRYESAKVVSTAVVDTLHDFLRSNATFEELFALVGSPATTDGAELEQAQGRVRELEGLAEIKGRMWLADLYTMNELRERVRALELQLNGQRATTDEARASEGDGA